jgi:hypothetical protein
MIANDELVRMWKEAEVIFREELDKTTKPSVKLARPLFKNRTKDIPNTNQEW